MVGTYNSWLVLLSILVAIFVSYTALSLSARVARAKNSTNTGMWVVGGALAMGCAIPVMHYTGMAAASFMPSTMPVNMSDSLSVSALGIAGIAGVTLVLLGFALLTSWVDRQFAAHA